MTLGEKIQILRKQNGLSQEALAEKTGCHAADRVQVGAESLHA